MTRFFTLTLTLLLTGGLLLVGCDSSGSTTGSTTDGSTGGTMDVTMTDGSTSSSTSSKSHVTSNLKKALTTLTEVSVSPEGDGELETLSSNETDLDLVKLKSGKQFSISDLSIPAGTYEQIRLKTKGDVALTLDDGSDTQKTAMLASSVLKLTFKSPFTVESPDDKVAVTVNWDVESSLEGPGGNDLDFTQGNLVITPAVEATANVTSATNDSNDGSES